jgi:DNA-binding NarL/FixJ family response regulator
VTDEERIDVVVVDDHDTFRDGIVLLLEPSQRLRAVRGFSRVSDLRAARLQFDACILDLIGVGDPAEIKALMAEVPVVVCTAAEDWRHLASAWVCGAKGVLGKNTGVEPLEDTVVDAVQHPQRLRAQLAAALLEAIDAYGVDIPPYLGELLDQVTRGRRTTWVLGSLGVAEDSYNADVERLREELGGTSLSVLRIPQLTPAGPAGAAVEPSHEPAETMKLTHREREIMTLYADGFSYPEIAAKLSIAGHTVRSHVLHAMKSLGIGDTHPQTRLITALFVSGRHRRPDLLRRRLEAVRNQGLQDHRDPDRLQGDPAGEA